MLSPADARICRADTGLPDLAVLLDAEAFGGVLRRSCPGADIGSITARYVRYKPATSCLAAFTVEVAGRRVEVYARCHRPDLSTKVDKPLQGSAAPGPLGAGVFAVPGRTIIVHVFPNDHVVRNLAKLFDPDRGAHRLSRVVRARPDLAARPPELLRYKPERRFVGVLSDHDNPAAALKVYPDADFDAARLRAAAFSSRGALRISPVIGAAQRYCAVASQWLEGPALGDLVKLPARAAGALDIVGSALAELHGQHPEHLAPISASAHAAAVRRAAAALAAVQPDAAPRIERLCERVCGDLAEVDWPHCALHGDFAPEQILLHDGCAGVVDFDRAAYGHPGIDLGLFTARLIEMAVDGALDFDSADAHAASFESGYCKTAGSDRDGDTQIFAAAALLLIAPESFRRRHHRWIEKTNELLDHVERIAERGRVAH